jgi:hypothetical protein
VPTFGNREFPVPKDAFSLKQTAALPHKVGSTDDLMPGERRDMVQPLFSFLGAQQVMIENQGIDLSGQLQSPTQCTLLFFQSKAWQVNGRAGRKHYVWLPGKNLFNCRITKHLDV